MDIVVEDGNGLPTANSYCSADEADDILSVNLYATAWTLLDDDDKESLLMWASRTLDQRVKWNGRKAFPTSGLAWPRYFVRDREGCMVEDNAVPQAVKIATATFANFLLTNAADPGDVDSSNNMTELRVDVILLKFDATIMKNKYPADIKYILQGLGTVSMGSGGPKYIVLH